MGKYDEKPEYVELDDGKEWGGLPYHRRQYLTNKKQVMKETKDRKDKIRIWFNEYKQTLSCERCGEGHPSTLDFHHKESEEKFMEVARMVTQGYSKERIKGEVGKCSVICSNCHRKEHYNPMLD